MRGRSGQLGLAVPRDCRLRPRRLAVGVGHLLALVTGLSACSSTAVIYRKDRPTREGEIVGGTDEVLYVRNERGVVLALRRSQIDYISHPGTDLMAASVVPLAIGGFFLGLSVTESTQDCSPPRMCEALPIEFLGAGLAFVGLGIALGAGGWATRSASVNAMDNWFRTADMPKAATPAS